MRTNKTKATDALSFNRGVVDLALTNGCFGICSVTGWRVTKGDNTGMFSSIIFLSALMFSVLAIKISTPIAIKIGLVDKPGGRKQHEASTPLVGGAAIFFSVFLTWLLVPILGLATINTILVTAGGLLFAIGLLDDWVQLSVRLRLAAQVVAALMLVYSGVVLQDLGTLFSDSPFTLGVLAIPLTIFATVGAINALNMLDGVDGLAGLTSLSCFFLLGVAAYVSHSHIQLVMSLCVMGSLGAFLLFNMPWKGRAKAHIFMGDAGSTLLGFLLAYLLISLSQGPQRAMSPVTTLWILAVPLLDTIGVMIRRVWLKKSPFSADRGHIHHLLLDAGLRVRQAVLLIAGLQLVLGGLGLAGFYFGVPEIVSLLAFILLLVAYVYLLSRPWRVVPQFRQLHRKTGLIVRAVRHVYVGGLNRDTAAADIAALLGEKAGDHPYKLYQYGGDSGASLRTYALIDAHNTDDVMMLRQHIRSAQASKKLKASLAAKGVAIVTRQYIPREPQNDRRCGKVVVTNGGQRQNDRRVSEPREVYCSHAAGRLSAA